MRYPLLIVLSVAVVTACGGKSQGAPHLAADRDACTRPSPVRNAVAHLQNFDVWGVGVVTSRSAISPLYPHYPDKVLVGKIGVAPHQISGRPVTITGFYCDTNHAIRFFQPSPGHPDLDVPQPAPASAISKAGVPSTRLTWPPPIQSLGDPDRWFFVPLFSRPGLAVLRFMQGTKVVDRLTVKVCIGNGYGCSTG